MYFSTKINEPEKGFDQIIAAASKFDADHYLYGLQYKNWNESKIELLSAEVSTYRSKLEAEYNRLVDFSKVFNKEFATMDNKCYSSALTMLRKLRSGISETKKLFMRFCPKVTRVQIIQNVVNKPKSAYDYSCIGSDAYQLTLFDFEGYPTCVNGLFNEMEKFFLLLIRCLQLCQQVLEDEKKIRCDNKYCKLLLENFKEKVLSEIEDITCILVRDSEYYTEECNPAIASRNRYDSDEAWAPIGFHNYSRKDVKMLVIKQTLDEEKGSDLTRTERNLFGTDETKVHKYRHIIKHFDKLIPESYHRKHLPAKYILMFFHYIGIQDGKISDAVNYFNEVYNSSPTHHFETVTYQAVIGYKMEVLQDKDGAYKAFAESLKQQFFANLTLQNASNF